ncbi:pilus assembly protein [Glycocaulis profundi]|nr:pilus assembly protein [Glycocaulis profundi]
MRGLKQFRDMFAAFRQATKGATAVEFALIAVPFLMLLFSIMEVAFIFFATTVIENAVVATSRQLRVGTIQTEAQFRDALCDRVRVVVNCDDLIVDVRGLEEFIEDGPDGGGEEESAGDDDDDGGKGKKGKGQGKGLVGGLLDVIIGGGDGGGDGGGSGGGPQFDRGAPGDIMVASALYEWQVIVPDIGLGLTNMSGNRRLVIASSAYRNEPESGVEP